MKVNWNWGSAAPLIFSPSNSLSLSL